MSRKIITVIVLFSFILSMNAQDFRDITIESDITAVQPMTGIVFWDGDNTNTDAITLEYSYMLFKDVVDLAGNFVWDEVEEKLDDIASRNHQAILRFRYAYVGETTAVPQYIKNLSDYTETLGTTEGEETWFPSWSHPELRDFNLRFYQAYAERYDGDSRLAFVQVGFGLWGEYHIYDGPFELGETFPSMAYQEQFFYHLDTIFSVTPWSISIDAESDKYAPFQDVPELLNIKFGNFDDSFMAQEHPQFNAHNWAFFAGNDRYRYSPAGGEFSYYTDWDQEHVLDYPEGSHGISFESSARDFNITYMIGNDQPGYQTMSRIKDASLAAGYKFQIINFKTATDSSIIIVKNVGIAPIYYPAFIEVDGVRAVTNLQGLLPGEEITCAINIGAGPNEADPTLTIGSDYILDGQKIDFYGTTFTAVNEIDTQKLVAKIYPNPILGDLIMNVELAENRLTKISIWSVNGNNIYEALLSNNKNTLKLPELTNGLYFVQLKSKKTITIEKILIQR